MRIRFDCRCAFVVALICALSLTGCEKPAKDEVAQKDAVQPVPPLLSVPTPSVPRADVPSLPPMPSRVTESTLTDDADNEDNIEPTVRDLNGETKDCEVYSIESGGTYTLHVEFEGDQARGSTSRTAATNT